LVIIRGRASRRLALSFLTVVLVTATTACSGSMTAPDQASNQASLSEPASAGSPASPLSAAHIGVASPGHAADYDLRNGSFTLSTVDGDISGDYTGHASVSSSGSVTASLELDVTSGTNDFQGATGHLKGDGTGAFVGEGSFSVSVQGSITTSAVPVKFHVRGAVSGTSFASCAAEGISITLPGDGSYRKGGDSNGKLTGIKAVLTHLVAGNAGCS
jgi:cytoskeletal protein CcmA (bactofilin family)